MAKPEWGMKRMCQSCGARYYDMRRSPITCTSCGAVFTPEQMPRRRGAAPAAVVPVPVPIPVPVVEEAEPIAVAAEAEDGEEAIEGVAETAAGEGKEKDKELIEDASDLGVDEDDVSEVKEHLDEGEGPPRT